MGLNNGKFNIRRSLPESGNKFYNTKSNGGYSTCIQGSPVCSGRNVLANCVGWACSRYNEVYSLLTGHSGMKYPSLNCNAENFVERAKNTYGLTVVPYPVLGGIMVWQKGNTLNGSDGAGHVAFVEDIIDGNTIYTSESGYGSSAFWNSTRSNSNGRWGLSSGYKFRGCIVNPAIGDVHYVAPTPSKPTTDDIETLARDVIAGKYGNGEDRKRALGDKYSAVQKRVNEILSGSSSSNNRYYTVQKGDTLWAIAKKYYGDGSKYHTIARANNISNPNIIRVGQKLLIP